MCMISCFMLVYLISLRACYFNTGIPLSAIVVHQYATVADLKKAIQRYVSLKQLRENGKQHISWYV